MAAYLRFDYRGFPNMNRTIASLSALLVTGVFLGIGSVPVQRFGAHEN
jgi:hypothetical protein